MHLKISQIENIEINRFNISSNIAIHKYAKNGSSAHTKETIPTNLNKNTKIIIIFLNGVKIKVNW
mgnify:CR=1 FL=1